MYNKILIYAVVFFLLFGVQTSYGQTTSSGDGTTSKPVENVIEPECC